ncbi:MAG: substrate-binding domain-containing protein [Acidimicrobiia bacterium]
MDRREALHDHPVDPEVGVFAEQMLSFIAGLATSRLTPDVHRNPKRGRIATNLFARRLHIERYEQFMRSRGQAEHIRLRDGPGAGPAFELGRQIFADTNGAGRPSAIYATSDTTAIGLFQAAYQAGLNIPNQLSLIGYDDIDIAPFTIPPLTTISQERSRDGKDRGRAGLHDDRPEPQSGRSQ